MRIKLITDSTADLPIEVVKKYDIEVLPLVVNFEDRSYVDGVEITSEEFYQKMRQAKKLPTTSQVPMQTFQEAFTKYLKEYDFILGIFLSSDLSGTYQTGVMVAQEIDPERIHLIDSRQVTMALGVAVIEAAKKNAEQMPKDELVAYMEEFVRRIRLRAIVGSLENLRKGGRLSAAAALIGSALKIKPIIETKDGLVDVLHKARGDKNAFKWLLDMVEAEADVNYPVVAGHSACEDRMSEMIAEVEHRMDIKIEYRVQLGAVVGTHAGEGCFGIAYITK